MDKGFRRIAITLMGITALSVILVGVYLWYNFNARSSLVLVVPEKSDWYIHVQTKEWLKEFQDQKKPSSLVEFESTFKVSPIFRGVTSPKEVGISPHSDWLFFGKNKASFLALSVFSEPALEAFCNRLVDSGYLQPAVKSNLFTRYKIAGKNAYLAFKHKAMVIGLMPDTVENAAQAQSIFNDIFSGKQSRFMENKELQQLYDLGSAVIAWKSSSFQNHLIAGPCEQFVFPFNQSVAIGFENNSCKIVKSKSTLPSQVLSRMSNGGNQTLPKKSEAETSRSPVKVPGKITAVVQPNSTLWQPLPEQVSSTVGLSILLNSIEQTMNRFSHLGENQ